MQDRFSNYCLFNKSNIISIYSIHTKRNRMSTIENCIQAWTTEVDYHYHILILNLLRIGQTRSDKAKLQKIHAKHEVLVICITKNPYINFLPVTTILMQTEIECLPLKTAYRLGPQRWTIIF